MLGCQLEIECESTNAVEYIYHGKVEKSVSWVTENRNIYRNRYHGLPHGAELDCSPDLITLLRQSGEDGQIWRNVHAVDVVVMCMDMSSNVSSVDHEVRVGTTSALFNNWVFHFGHGLNVLGGVVYRF